LLDHESILPLGDGVVPAKVPSKGGASALAVELGFGGDEYLCRDATRPDPLL
jgi:hypothetical protein